MAASTPSRSIWFGVLISSKVNGKEKREVCIVHLQFEKRVSNRSDLVTISSSPSSSSSSSSHFSSSPPFFSPNPKVLNVVKKGAVEYTAEFGMVESADKENDSLGLQVKILGRGVLDIRTQSEDDRDLLWLLLDKVVKGQDNTVTESILSSHNAPVLLSGMAQKKGKLTWSKRFLVLHKWGLLLYRNSSYQNSWPLNIIILENAIFTAEGQIVIIHTKFRDYRLSFDKDKIEQWMKAFNQLSSMK